MSELSLATPQNYTVDLRLFTSRYCRYYWKLLVQTGAIRVQRRYGQVQREG